MSGTQRAVPGGRLLDELAQFLAFQPGAVRQISQEHVPDAHGKCQACGDRARGTHPAWPCTPVLGAQRAAR